MRPRWLLVMGAVALMACGNKEPVPAPKGESHGKTPPAPQPPPPATKPSAPTAYGAGPKWTLGQSAGSVTVNGQPAAKGDVVTPGAVVVTDAGDGNVAALDLPFDVRASLRPETKTVRGENGSLLLIQGTVSVSVPPMGNVARKETRLVTAWGVVDVLGSGELEVSVAPSGEATVSVRAGAIVVTPWPTRGAATNTPVAPDKSARLTAAGLKTGSAASAKALSAAERTRVIRAALMGLRDTLARFQSEMIRGRALAGAQREAMAAHADAQVKARQKELVTYARGLLALRTELRLAYERAVWWQLADAGGAPSLRDEEQAELKNLLATALSHLRRAPSAP